jgi:RHS repeat-associated protein
VYLENADDAEGDSTLYSYDILGNVKTLLQHVKALVAVDANNGRKRIDYDYDLVSGKVNMVSYQSGKGDQFYYKYLYDADNRVIGSCSSRDKLIWTEDADYTYYLHGPLARTELGQYKVQGVDYAYTLQGWLKGINSDSLSPLYDMAMDGRQNTTYSRVSRDVYAFKLGYFNGDYTPIDVTNATAFANKPYTAPTGLNDTGDSLFNGNISFSTLALSKINAGATSGYSYGYDQLNRLVEMRQHTTNAGGGWSNSDIITAYRESVAYDANGNITKYLRHGDATTPDMDSLTYKYNRDGSGNLVNNKLDHVNDQVSSSNYSVDIDNQSAGNYGYDEIGNLKKDVSENIDTVRWTVYGKINKIVKSSGSVNIKYGYDAGGNRTTKIVSGAADTTTYYIRDAQGNVLAVYTKKGTDSLKWDEQHLYGSSRLGMWLPDSLPTSPPIVMDSTAIQDSLMIGSRTYELTNHLGNVLSTISDKKIGNDSSGTVNYYIAEVLSQMDFYPFGMLQPERQYSPSSSSGLYRYGFNGKENDNEVKGEGNQQDYGMRIYDPRLGRFLSVDPISREYPYLTPYQFSSNRPIDGVDIDGLEYFQSAKFGGKSSLYLLQMYRSDGNYTYDADAFEKGKLIKNPPEKMFRIMNRKIHEIVMNHPQNYEGIVNTDDDAIPEVKMVKKQKNTRQGRAIEEREVKAAAKEMSPDMAQGLLDLIKWGEETYYDIKYKKELQYAGGSLNSLDNADKLGRAAFNNGSFPSVLLKDEIETDIVNYLTDGTLPAGGSFGYKQLILTWGSLIFNNREAILKKNFDFRPEHTEVEIKTIHINADGWQYQIKTQRQVGNKNDDVINANKMIETNVPQPPGNTISREHN